MVLSVFFGDVEVVIILTCVSGRYPFWRSRCRIQIIHILTQSSLREKDFCWDIAVLIHTTFSAGGKDDVCNFYCVELMIKQRKRSAECLTSAPSICLFAHRKQSKIHTHTYNSSLQSLLIISSRVVGMWLFFRFDLLQNICVKWYHNYLLCVQAHPCVCWLVGRLLCQQDNTENCWFDFYYTQHFV